MAVDRKYSEKSYPMALGLLLLDFSLFGITLYGALVVENLFLRFLCSFLAGWLIAIIFVLGHDACHGSLTRNKKFNKIIGIIAFLPSLHPYHLWALGHHKHHHKYTNLAGDKYDYVWNPYSKEDFDALPKHKQWLERFSRSWAGHGVGYMTHIWWKKMYFPRSKEIMGGYKKEYVFDNILMAITTVSWVGGIVALSEYGVIDQPWWSALFFGFIFPCLIVWNWSMGFCVLVHHNHPDIRWYKDHAEWKEESNNVNNTCHVELPWIINKCFHNMMEHNAHHMAVSIPCYNLLKAVNNMKERYPGQIKYLKWTPKVHSELIKHCQLYDYENHVWLDFDGNPSKPLSVDRKEEEVSLA